jgi:hypothetical protein
MGLDTETGTAQVLGMGAIITIDGVAVVMEIAIRRHTIEIIGMDAEGGGPTTGKETGHGTTIIEDIETQDPRHLQEKVIQLHRWKARENDKFCINACFVTFKLQCEQETTYFFHLTY